MSSLNIFWIASGVLGMLVLNGLETVEQIFMIAYTHYKYLIVV